MEILIQLCKKYRGKFYQNGIEKSGPYLSLDQTNDYKGIFKYKNELIVVKKVVHYNPFHIFINVESNTELEFKIQIKTFINAAKNLFGQGNPTLGRYEFFGSMKHFSKLKSNQRIIEILEQNEITIELVNNNKTYLLLKPFHGMTSLIKCEELLELLVLIKQEVIFS